MPDRSDTLEIGLIADTHDLVRPEALAALEGVDQILHAGDVCTAAVLEQLAAIAPVTAVRGNNDHGAWADALPEEQTLELGGVRVRLRHIAQDLGVDPARDGIDVVVSGHSHRPTVEDKLGVLWVNPGSAGPRRFTLPISVARMRISAGRAHVELRVLPV